MSKHTPGPWTTGSKYFGSSDHVFETARIPENSSDWGEALICETGGNTANARLIAAAPETADERDRLLIVNAALKAALCALIEESRKK